MNRLMTMALMATLLAGCGKEGSTSEVTEQDVRKAVKIWLSADQDTSVGCRPGQGINLPCTPLPADGLAPRIRVGSTPTEQSRAYVHFTLPELPPGSEVAGAYMQLYHDGAATDCDPVGFVPVEQPWSAHGMSYMNQPVSYPGVNEFPLTCLNGNGSGWWTSPNITRYVNYKYANRQLNYGFVSTLPVANRAYSYVSINDAGRTLEDLGRSPRLLINVLLPPGATANDIRMPGLHPDHDLPARRGDRIRMMSVAAGVDWPASWRVR